MPDPSNEWAKEFRQELQHQRDSIKSLEGEVAGDRRVAEERHRQIEYTNKEIKADLALLSQLVTKQSAALYDVVKGQDSILQTMKSDTAARLETARALKEAEEARRQAENGPWVTPNRVLGFMVTIAVLIAYVAKALGG